MLKLTPLLLFLTLPLLPSTPCMGVPLWAWVSIGMSIVYGLVLIILIEKTWQEEEHG